MIHSDGLTVIEKLRHTEYGNWLCVSEFGGDWELMGRSPQIGSFLEAAIVMENGLN